MRRNVKNVFAKLLAPAELRRAAGAVSLSAVAVAAAIVLQGVVFFRQDVEALGKPSPVVRQFALGQSGRSALVRYFTPTPLSIDAPQYSLAACDLTATPPQFKAVATASWPRKIAAARHGRHGFVAMLDGQVCAVDLAAERPELIPLGFHAGGHLHGLACCDDGSLVAVASNDLRVWDRQARRLLWQREGASGIAFQPRTSRLFCALSRGAIVELDCRTGVTLREIVPQGAITASQSMLLEVSPDGQWIAGSNQASTCIVVDVRRGRAHHFHRRLSRTLVPFSHDSRAFYVTDLLNGPHLGLFCVKSGAMLNECAVGDHLTCDLAVASDGTAYACDSRGVVLVWEPGAPAAVPLAFGMARAKR